MALTQSFAILLLLTSAIFCALLAIFSLKEREKRSHPLYILLLGEITIWYLGFSVYQMALYEKLVRVLKVPVFGLARPMLILIFAQLAHGYLIAVRERNANFIKRLRPWMLYGFAVLIITLMRDMLADRHNNAFAAATFALIGLSVPLSLIFICYYHLRVSALRSDSLRSPVLKSSSSKTKTPSPKNIWLQPLWGGAFLISLIMIIAAFIHSLSGNTAPSLYDIFGATSVVPLIFWLVYYHTPYLFLDILVKRGIQSSIFAIIFGIYYGFVIFVMKIFEVNPIQIISISTIIIAAIIVSLPMGIIVSSQNKIDAFLDLKVLGRNNLSDGLLALNHKLGLALTKEDAIKIVCPTLTEILGASSVKFELMLPKDQLNTINIEVSNNEHKYGYLIIGAALGGRRYLSEDIKFIHLAASNLSAVLARREMEAERQAQQLRELELINTATELKLQALQAQLDPHFLFNSMNLIGSLVRTNPDQARRAVQHLARIYRYVLDSSQRKLVKLADEMAFIHDYLEIEQMRFETRLQTRFNITNRAENYYVPPMILQPLVENSIKHGLSPKIDGGFLNITAQEEDDSLIIAIEDNGVGFDINKPINRVAKGNGVALANIVQQLKLRYQIDMIIDSKIGLGTNIRFKLPLALIINSDLNRSSTDGPLIDKVDKQERDKVQW